jgi:hypothetical protein
MPPTHATGNARDDNRFNETARRLRNAVEPLAAGVYLALKANAAYQALRFGGSPITQDSVARPEMKTYFLSRSACMGQVPGEVRRPGELKLVH